MVCVLPALHTISNPVIHADYDTLREERHWTINTPMDEIDVPILEIEFGPDVSRCMAGYPTGALITGRTRIAAFVEAFGRFALEKPICTSSQVSTVLLGQLKLIWSYLAPDRPWPLEE